MRTILPVLLKDGYKADHKRQYPEGTTLVYSNFTPRGSRIDGVDDIVFFGLQYFVKEFLINQFQENFFSRPKADVMRAYKRRMDNYLGPDAFPMDHIGDLHDLGYLPLKIKALPEGSLVPLRTPVLTIHNTKPEFFWLTNMLETLLSTELWLPCTSATTSLQYLKTFHRYAKETGGSQEFIPFQAHDFSFRGMTCTEAALKSAAAHLLSFVGTDTIPAIDFLEEYYNANSDEEMVGVSVAATEHSVMCLGSKSGELDTFRRLIEDVYPAGIVSIVSDTWDFWQVMTEFLPELRDKILARDGKVVIRPDSGDPVLIVCGDPESNDPAVRKGAIECLWDTFGGTTNPEGFKTLDPHIGLIYGDSITMERQRRILELLKRKGFASDNIVFGVGSYTFQYVTRDTFGFAMKATYGEVNGEGRSIFKDPKTDDGLKKSARGLLHVNRHMELTHDVDWEIEATSALETVFENGKLMRDHSLSELRERVQGHV